MIHGDLFSILRCSLQVRCHIARVHRDREGNGWSLPMLCHGEREDVAGMICISSRITYSLPSFTFVAGYNIVHQ